ncbi:hypothetical protein [Faecalibacterium gallinarum]|uniref:Uncharacterized protein n=1 Tax=Faecalibacterium gallinarum TaxID=2903556 RepID=A0AA37J0S0_9FIRM|nr:hypothetical protein [Faecalibacterium gallinarum]GJN65763.1 hypothetical protein JCM17207_23880 [Faecalibacterium gallinarum]
MREFCVSMPGVEDVTDGSVDSFEIDWVRESDQDCPASCGETQSRCRCAGCGGRGRCSCTSRSSRCSQSASRCSRSCSNRCGRTCAGSAGAVETSSVDWEEYEIVDE